MNPKLPAISVNKSRSDLGTNQSNIVQKSKPHSREQLKKQESAQKMVVNFSLTHEQMIQEGVKNLIHEYLVKTNMIKTLEIFKEEVVHGVGRPAIDYQETLQHYFDQGNKAQFFEVWKKYVPMSMRVHDKETIKLEFFVNLYFITAKLASMNRTKRTYNKNFRIEKKVRDKVVDHSSMHENESDATNQVVKQAMAELKSFLIANGEELAKIEELLPYYALPYLKDPYTHPHFREIFTDEWRSKIKIQLREVLTNLYPAHSKPFLVQLYENNLKTSEASDKMTASLGMNHSKHLSPSNMTRKIKESSQSAIKQGSVAESQMNLNKTKSLRSISEMKHDNSSKQVSENESQALLGDDKCFPNIDRCESGYHPSPKAKPAPQKNILTGLSAKVKHYVEKLEADNKNLVDLIEILNKKSKESEIVAGEAAKKQIDYVKEIESKWKGSYKDLYTLSVRLLDFANIFRSGREQFIDIIAHRLAEFKNILDPADDLNDNSPFSKTEYPTSIDSLRLKTIGYLRGEFTRQLCHA